MRIIICSLFFILISFSSNVLATVEEIKKEMSNTPVKIFLTKKCIDGTTFLNLRYENQRAFKIFIPRRLVDKDVYQLAFLTLHFRDEKGYLQTVPQLIKDAESIYDLDYIPVEGGASLEMPLELHKYFAVNNTTEYIAYDSFRFEIITSQGAKEIANNNSYTKFVNDCSK